jgi:hypothetical protein
LKEIGRAGRGNAGKRRRPWLREAGNVAELYRRMEAFLDKNIGPNAKVATSP